jgi:enoyl-CoA hydratase/carnithine racemase
MAPYGEGATMQSFLNYEQDGPVATVAMNRPAKRNALTDFSQFQEYVDLCQHLGGDLSVRALILTGAGSAFCAGGDINKMKDGTGNFAGSPVELHDNYRNGIQRIPLALYQLEAPTIAAVNGLAIGAGCDLACMCDIRITSERATFAESFINLGMIPGDGGAWLLQRVIG